jgi:hypothetical protein
MSRKEDRREITILDDREIVTYPKLNQPARQHVVTYQADQYPPRTIWIPSDQYSEKTLQDAIKRDLAELEKTKPKTMMV